MGVRIGSIVVALGLSGCGPLVVVPEEEGTSKGEPPEDDDVDDKTTSTTTPDPSTSTPLPMTTPVPTTVDPGTTGPVGDCVDLELLGGPTGPGLTAGTTNGAGDDFQFCQAGGETGGVTGTGDDYVVAWTAAIAGPYHFTLAGSDYDTVLGVFPPECGGVPYECNDDCLDSSSSVDYVAGEGETIYIVVDGFYGQTGNFVLNILTGFGECSSSSTTGGQDTGISFVGPE